MAIVQNPIIGRSSGQAAGMVFTTQFGKNVMKAKPASVANPQSDKQLERRDAVTQIVAIFRAIVSAATAGFNSLAVGMSAYNAFASYNIKNAFTFDDVPPAVLVLADLLVSKGSIASTVITSIVLANADATVTVNFPTTTAGAGQSASDLAIIAAYNEDTDEWYGELTTAARSTGTASIEMPTAVSTGDTVHIYLGFSSVNGATQSTSIYDSEICA